jgi:hypothetical protein
MDEKSLLAWFDQIGTRITIFRTSPTGEHDAWASLFTEMQTALESIFPQSHPVLRRWEDALSRGKQSQRGNHLQTPEKYVSKELMGTFEAAHRLLQEGHARRFADGIRAETIAQCLGQAETLARFGYASAAMVLAGGALETHLLHLCERFCLSWQGDGSISKYNQALGQARSQGMQDLVTSSDSSAITSWGQDRNGAAHSPLTFTKTQPEVLLIVEGIRQFLLRTQ